MIALALVCLSEIAAFTGLYYLVIVSAKASHLKHYHLVDAIGTSALLCVVSILALAAAAVELTR